MLYSPTSRDLYLGAVEVTAIDQKCVSRDWRLVVAEWIFRKWVEWRLNVGVLIVRCGNTVMCGRLRVQRREIASNFAKPEKTSYSGSCFQLILSFTYPTCLSSHARSLTLEIGSFISFPTIQAFSLLSKCLAGESWRPRDFCELNVPPHRNWDIHSQSSSSFAIMPTRLLKYQKWQNQSLRALWSSGQNKLGIMLSKMRKLLRSRQIKSV